MAVHFLLSMLQKTMTTDVGHDVIAGKKTTYIKQTTRISGHYASLILALVKGC